MPPRRRIQTALIALGVVLACLGVTVIALGGPRSARRYAGWLVFDAKLKLKFEADASAGSFREEVARRPTPLAKVVRELRTAWPNENVATVHGAADEVAMCLLHHDDVEVGDVVGGKFVAWPLAPWNAAAKIRDELKVREDFLEDETRYVFRRK